MLILNFKKERGSILIYSLLLLSSILAISLTLATIFLPKIRATANAGANSSGALYAADSAVEWCLYTSRGNPTLPAPTMSNGASYTITPNDCTTAALNTQIVGTYRNVSRSLQVTQ
jgi:hypothetical protein